MENKEEPSIDDMIKNRIKMTPVWTPKPSQFKIFLKKVKTQKSSNRGR